MKKKVTMIIASNDNPPKIQIEKIVVNLTDTVITWQEEELQETK